MQEDKLGEREVKLKYFICENEKCPSLACQRTTSKFVLSEKERQIETYLEIFSF